MDQCNLVQCTVCNNLTLASISTMTMTQICLESLHGAQRFKHNHCKHHDFLSCSSNLGNLGTLQEKCSGSLRIEDNTVQGEAKLNWISSFLGSGLVWKNQHTAVYAKLTSWWLRPIWTIGSFPQIGNMKNISKRHLIKYAKGPKWMKVFYTSRDA